MKKDKERLEHALHNEKVCKYLALDKDFADWIITTAFYSALQYVSYKIFPFEVPAIEGKKTVIRNIDDLHNYNSTPKGSKKISKHELLADLVDKKCNSIAPDYDWLLDMSMKARYTSYQHDKAIANKAIRLMESIKKFCSAANK